MLSQALEKWLKNGSFLTITLIVCVMVKILEHIVSTAICHDVMLLFVERKMSILLRCAAIFCYKPEGMFLLQDMALTHYQKAIESRSFVAAAQILDRSVQSCTFFLSNRNSYIVYGMGI